MPRLSLTFILPLAISLTALMAFSSFAFDTDLAAQAIQAIAEGKQLTIDQKLAYDAAYNPQPVPSASPHRDRRGGPDDFGYRWRDNEDGAQYAWIDITQGAMEGNQFGNLSDDWNSGEQQLDWNFNFYGNDFSSVWVSSNGWISFSNPQTPGDYTPQGEFPNQNDNANIVAIFFNDLHPTNGGQGQIWWYTNADDQIAIFSWINYHHIQNNGPYTFQIIIRGNGRITYNYVDNNAIPDGRPLCIGIMNGNRDVGLSIMYENAGRVPQEEYCIEISKAAGWVAGTVTDMETDEPLQGANVVLSDGSSGQTDAEGHYLISDVLEDAFTATARLRGYNSVTSDQFDVTDQDTSIIDFALPHPEIRLDVEAIGAQLPQHGAEDQSFNVINDGNGPLDYAMHFTIGQQRDAVGDVLFDWNATDATNDQRIRGVTILGEEIFLTGSNNAAEPNYIHVIDQNGEFVRRFEQPVQNNSAIGMKGITTDGTYLYAADSRDIIKFTTEGEAVGTIPGPLNPSRYLTYDPETDHFWVCDVTSQLVEIDRDGNIIRRVAKPIRAYGISWQPNDLDSCYIYVFHRVPDSSQLAVSKINPLTGRLVHLTNLQIRDGDVANGCVITNGFNPLVWLMLSLVENGVPDRLVGVELSLNTSWVHVNPMRGAVEPASSAEASVTFDAGTWMPGQYELLLVIESNAMTDRIDLPVSMVVTDEGLAPQHFSFQPTGIVHGFSVTAVQLRGERAVWGDEIGVFTPNGLCVGASIWFNQLTRLEAFGDDPATDAIDGFQDGERFSFRVWDRSVDREFAADFNLTTGDGSFRGGGASRLSLTVPGLRRDNSWSLPFGWSLISANINPDNPALDQIFADPIASGGLMLVKNGAGQFFYPRDGFNNIGNWQGTQGYWVKNLTTVNFATSGDALTPNTQIDVNAGWNLIAYVPNIAMDATAAFAPLGNNLIVAKDGAGRFFLPEQNFSNIGSATPGNGYAVMVRQNAEFSYPANGRDGATVEPRLTTHIPTPASTGSSMSLLVTGSEIEIGSEIIAVAVDGSIVGAGAAMENGRLGLAVWGDDVTTSARDGLTIGEPYSIKIWDGSLGWVQVGVTIKSGEMTFNPDGIVIADLAGASQPTDLVLNGAYPNPFNGVATVSFRVPSTGIVTLTLHDLVGRQVSTLLNGELTAGSHSAVLQAGDLASGTYLLKLQSVNGSRTAKVLLIR